MNGNIKEHIQTRLRANGPGFSGQGNQILGNKAKEYLLIMFAGQLKYLLPADSTNPDSLVPHEDVRPLVEALEKCALNLDSVRFEMDPLTCAAETSKDKEEREGIYMDMTRWSEFYEVKKCILKIVHKI